mmetsp:Transcript_69333/g.180607  ORF Transcript_69333/g.180607 Transcript_69333/m.180607 type:complete len:801 (+) Transcript_69333:92-2494(+)
MSVLQWFSDVFSAGSQSEILQAGLEEAVMIVVFAVAISLHTFLFGGFGAKAKPRKGVKGSIKTKASPDVKEVGDRKGTASARDDAAAFRAGVRDLRAALAASDLHAALRHLRTVAPQWRAAGDATPSAAPDGLLQGLVRLAVEQSMVPLLLAALGQCGLLTERVVEAVLRDPAQRASAASVLQVLQLAQGQGIAPTSAMNCALIGALGVERRVQEALAVFDACAEKPACLHNAILGVLVGHCDMPGAERILAGASAAGVADATTYGTVIKAYLKGGNVQPARATMEAMRAAGLPPSVVILNEFLKASLASGSDDFWKVIDDMVACGAHPNQVTCSILLKNIQSSSCAADVERTMAVLNLMGDQMGGFTGSMGDQMDEVLLFSACEAAVRAGRADLVHKLLERLGGEGGARVRGAQTYGSIIRARGYVGDLDGVRSTWAEMRSQGITPTSVTTGCMVEALVSNDGPEAGHRLIREMLGEEELRPLINSVIYNSVLKGFVQHKMFDRVWDVQAEMRRERVQPSIVTYNTIVDACAKSNGMSRVPALMEEMASSDIQAGAVTYSTMMKGYVQENRVDKAFELMDEMKLSKDIKPDEIAYNTLLDGCARQCLFERGMQVLSDMQDNGIQPSNFTLSVLVKLANRSRRLDQAFELCDRVSRKHCLRPNIHVFNNLMQACTAHKDHDRALQVLARAAEEGVRPDARTYGILLRGCAVAGDLTRVADLVRAAYGLRGGAVAAACCGEDAAALQVRGGLPFELLSEAFAGLRGQQEDVALELLRELRGLPSSRVDMKVLTRLATKIVR